MSGSLAVQRGTAGPSHRGREKRLKRRSGEIKGQWLEVCVASTAERNIARLEGFKYVDLIVGLLEQC